MARIVRSTLASLVFAGMAALPGLTLAQTPADSADKSFGRGGSPYSEAVAAAASSGQDKIVGGKVAIPNAYPWAVSLQVNPPTATPTSFCGGTAYNDDWVITAAHCLFDDKDKLEPLSSFTVGWSTGRLADATRRRVQLAVVHRNYDHNTYDNDIALLKLGPALPSLWRAVPIALATKADEAELLKNQTLLTVVGWGRLDESVPGGSTVLRYLELPLVDRATCNRRLGYDGEVTDNMLCAGYTAGGKDSCKGDSGGPLTSGSKSPVTAKLVGIVSWGYGCARPNKVGIYTRVSTYKTWIERCVAAPGSCR